MSEEIFSVKRLTLYNDGIKAHVHHQSSPELQSELKMPQNETEKAWEWGERDLKIMLEKRQWRWRPGNEAVKTWEWGSEDLGMRQQKGHGWDILGKITSVHFCNVLTRSVITPALASCSLRSELLARSFTVPSPYTMASVSVRGSAVERRSVRGPTEGERGGRRERGGEKWWKKKNAGRKEKGRENKEGERKREKKVKGNMALNWES